MRLAIQAMADCGLLSFGELPDRDADDSSLFVICQSGHINELADTITKERVHANTLDPPEQMTTLRGTLGFSVGADGGYHFQCMLCHAGNVLGKPYVGAPNRDLDMTTFIGDLAKYSPIPSSFLRWTGINLKLLFVSPTGIEGRLLSAPSLHSWVWPCRSRRSHSRSRSR